MHARRVQVEDALGDRLVGAAEVHRRLERHQPLRPRLDADAAQQLGVERLHAALGHHHPDAAALQHRSAAHFGGAALPHAAARHEAAIGQQPDHRPQRHRSAVAAVGLAAEAHGDRLPHPGRGGRGHHFGIGDHRHDRVLHAARQQLAQHDRAVARGAPAGVVGAVGQHHQPGRFVARVSDRLPHRRQGHVEVAPSPPDGAGQLAGPRRGQLRRAVRGDQHRSAGVADVGKRKAVGDGGVQHRRLPLHGLRPAQQGAGRRDQRALPRRHGDERQLQVRQPRAYRACRRGVDQPPRLQAALEGIHVGILLEPDDGVGVRRHARGDVGMQVQGHHQRRRLPHYRSRSFDQIALRVLQVFAHHGAVQVEQHPAAAGRAPAPGETLQQHPGELFVGVPRHHSRGRGERPQQRLQLEAQLLSGRQIPAVHGAGAAEVAPDLLSRGRRRRPPAKIEVGQPGRRDGEGVGFVAEGGAEEDGGHPGARVYAATTRSSRPAIAANFSIRGRT